MIKLKKAPSFIG